LLEISLNRFSAPLLPNTPACPETRGRDRLVAGLEDSADLPCLPIDAARHEDPDQVGASFFWIPDVLTLVRRSGYSFLKLQNFLRDREVLIVSANKDSSRMRGAGKSVGW